MCLHVAGAGAWGLVGDGSSTTQGQRSTQRCELDRQTTPGSSLMFKWRATSRACYCKYINSNVEARVEHLGSTREASEGWEGNQPIRFLSPPWWLCAFWSSKAKMALQGGLADKVLLKEAPTLWGPVLGGQPRSEPGTGSLCPQPAGTHHASSLARRGDWSLRGRVKSQWWKLDPKWFTK